jgi:hypothetical protein
MISPILQKFSIFNRSSEDGGRKEEEEEEEEELFWSQRDNFTSTSTTVGILGLLVRGLQNLKS